MVIAVEWEERDRAAIARRILEDLPAWFGIPEAREDYIADAARLPMLTARQGGEAVGFLCLRRHTAAAFEVAVIAVLHKRHRRGCGRAMMAAAAVRAAAEGADYLTAKTLAPTKADEGYRRTRAFYDSLGFVPLEIFPTLWGPEAPCLMMLKPLAGG